MFVLSFEPPEKNTTTQNEIPREEKKIGKKTWLRAGKAEKRRKAWGGQSQTKARKAKKKTQQAKKRRKA